MEVGHDEYGIRGAEAKEPGDGDERVRDGPVLERYFETAEGGKRLRM